MSYSGASTSVPRLSNDFASRRTGFGPLGNITQEEIPITNNACDCVIAVAASQASPRTVVIQFNNSDGSPIKHTQQFDMGVYADAGGIALAATGGSTGMAVDGTAGIIEATVVAKKVFMCRTDANGKWSGTWTDTAHEVAFLGVVLPTKRTVYSAALTTA